MAKSECKKCHKPLASGNKCDACKQKEKNKIKSVGTVALTAVGGAVLFVGKKALPILKKIK